ncbi:MAG TPA: 4Fe-4S dicluster domain-containing protein [Thermoanaerobaculia bacterium]|nr:4Fe-4S dicluster domain-containing protein [Thermoanaerobaculia bacterium]HUM30110.1 4Fe-4S dicluster domain-containing protein [Thermoanaerobaculia bacterium]HXK68807.1 4Fe-4S dicluster domain-containing protein [Thermoanaerobaculia bacterium]
MKRRDFLKLIGIGSGTVISACKWNSPEKKLISYLVPPEEGIIPGEPYYVRSTCTECPAACGMVVKLREGNPVKLEGNPDHPLNRGALCIRGQASLTRLYHPDRVKQPLLKSKDGSFAPVSWDTALSQIRDALKESKAAGKESVYMAGRTTGSLATLIDEFCASSSVTREKEFEFYNHGALRKAYNLLFGTSSLPSFNFDGADLCLSIGADLAGAFLNPVHATRILADAREKGMTWIHIEPHLTLSGVSSDRRFVIHPEGEAHLLAYLLRQLPARRPIPARLMESLPNPGRESVLEATGLTSARMEDLIQSITSSTRPVVLCGDVSLSGSAGLMTALLAVLLQWSLGNIPDSLDFTHDEVMDSVGTLKDVQSLITRLNDGRIGTTFLSRLHALHTVENLESSFSKSDFSIVMTDLFQPWMKGCSLVLPLSHGLESWGDASSRRGIRSVVQPAIKPLYGTRTEGDILLALMGDGRTYQQYLIDHWTGFGSEWIDRGVREESVPSKKPSLQASSAAEAVFKKEILPKSEGGAALYVTSGIRTFDGRSRDLTLLQEIPDPLSSVSYGDYLSGSPEDLKELGVKDGDEVEIGWRSLSIQLPVRQQAGLPGGRWMISLDAMRNAHLPVVDTTGECLTCLRGISTKRTGRTVTFPILSGSTDAKGRGIVPHEDGAEHHHHGDATLYPDHEHDTYRWSLAIDLDLCTGCSACVAACYLENNVAITGYEEHLKGREMSWIRISPYEREDGGLELMPVMCQQCDKAPCEPVCPVFATFHNPEGLNAQVYNRCVGTRYCANNCPYKVRRFNWFDHTWESPLDQMLNPDVSKRPKGVMEKCTFCIQRIRYAKDRAKDEGREVRDGEIIPACAQTCPARAITFGSMMDEGSRVKALAEDSRASRILEQLGTEPAVYYLKKEEGGRHES